MRLVTREEGGSGQLLLLLHGAARNLEDWQAVVPHLTPHFRVVTVDLPGHGRSGVDTWSFAHAVDSVIELAREPAVVAGHSLGGMVATLCAALPQVLRAVNLDGLGAGLGRELTVDRRRLLADIAVQQLPGCADPLSENAFTSLLEQVERGCRASGLGPGPVIAGLRRGSRVADGLVRAVPDEATVRAVLAEVDALDLARAHVSVRAPLRVVRCTRSAVHPGSPDWLEPARRAHERRVDALLAAAPPLVEVVEADATHGLLLENPALTASLIMTEHA